MTFHNSLGARVHQTGGGEEEEEGLWAITNPIRHVGEGGHLPHISTLTGPASTHFGDGSAMAGLSESGPTRTHPYPTVLHVS